MGNKMRAARFLAILLLLVAIIAAALYLIRLPLAGWAVRSAMAGAGLEQPQATVTALTFDGIRLEKVSSGAEAREAFQFHVIEVDYHWRQLLSAQKVAAVRAGPGLLRVNISDGGQVSIPGLASGGEGSGGAELPFQSLILSSIRLHAETSAGSAVGELSAEFEKETGGRAEIELESNNFGLKELTIPAGKINAELELAESGSTALVFAFKGDMLAQGVAANNVSLAIDGEGVNWRDLIEGERNTVAGNAHISFSAPQILFGSAQNQETLNQLAPIELAFGQSVSEAALEGEFDVNFSDSVFEVRLRESAPVTLAAPDGTGLTIAQSGAAPLYALRGERETASFQFAIKSAGVNAAGSADIERENDRWRVAAPITVEQYSSPELSLDDSQIEFSGVLNGDDLTADLALKSGLRRAQIGRLSVSDAPFTSAFRAEGNLSAQTVNIYNREECITFERGQLRLEEQNAEASLGRTQLCNADGPLLVFTWAGDMVCSLNGEISSANGRFSLGETSASGRPPNIRFNAVYNPLDSRTTIEGIATGGDVTLNEMIDLSAMIGRFDFSLDPAVMRASGVVDRVRAEQSAELKFITPVIADGTFELEGKDTTFQYSLMTPAGNALGVGTGRHDMSTASGETTFTFQDLRFEPEGLQPNELAPGLKGIVSAATGGADGAVRFGWSKEGITSGANFDLNDISFDGPTLAVTRTTGVNGSVTLNNLLPVSTEGVQTLTLNIVDAGALELTNGEVSFEFPGNDTLQLKRGEFPWFGGTIGAYEATASFSGAATIPLRAENIHLEQVLDFASVEGLSGEGVLSGSLPLVFEDGKARIENGVFRSNGPGAIRYTGPAADAASAAGENAQVAFDFLRDLRYKSLEVTVNGALDGQLDFGLRFEGTGDLTVRNQSVQNVPVLYRINLTVENMDLIRQANLLRSIELKVQEELSGRGAN
ncbi:YdbH domain-containing protein [Hyphococcus flavus]|uniref:YdbH domain-containing protein n=1 Tax=Hyphococcus flavus TaxID=1866326 RepID=A0AAE9ZDS9_9PROT|nr:YdbH domain-containing protein [Hyphococcus flavus]WDI31775.1 YdbH domain-containing protein [Hyphococcus flavus]